jgi:CubicO group peptidase (beta-lactamase class C family)
VNAALLLAIAVQRGEERLDDPISEHLPERSCAWTYLLGYARVSIIDQQPDL